MDCGSIITSNNFDETTFFQPNWVENKKDFTKYVALAFPGDGFASVRQRIAAIPFELYDFNQQVRLRRVSRDSTFVLNKG